MLPKPPAEDKREAVEALRLFAAALQDYPGRGKDVEVDVAVYQEGATEQDSRVQITVYVPKTDYVNIVLVARCTGNDGFPVKIDPYFAGGSFPNGFPPCQDRQQLDDSLRRFAQSPEMLSLLEYMRKHAR